MSDPAGRIPVRHTAVRLASLTRWLTGPLVNPLPSNGAFVIALDGVPSLTCNRGLPGSPLA